MKFIKTDNGIFINTNAIQKIFVGKYEDKHNPVKNTPKYLWFVRAIHTTGNTYDNLHNTCETFDEAQKLCGNIILELKKDNDEIDVNYLYDVMTKTSKQKN